MNLFVQARFIAAAGRSDDFPPLGPPEIALAGRSNVGKSSAINALVSRRRLARTSKTPGRTQTINFYDLGERARLVDLPGYGYARVPRQLRDSWRDLVGGYLSARRTLVGLIVLVDARHPNTPADAQLFAWLAPLVRAERLRLAVLLTKSDKLSRAAGAAALEAGRRSLRASALAGETLLFSSVDGRGVAQVREFMEGWLTVPSTAAPSAESPTAPSHYAKEAAAPGHRRRNKRTPG